MKAITVKQPWAWLIAHGGKNIENRPRRTHYRPRRTHYRGPVAIHAGLAHDRLDDDLPRGVTRPDPDDLAFGAIIAVGEITDCLEDVRSKWYAQGQFGWVISNVRPIAHPIACKGALGLWNLSPVGSA